MEFNEIENLTEELILEKRAYKHREGYKGNIKGSYIDKGKTKWDYSNGQLVGNERIVTQIQLKAKKKFDKNLSREEIKRFLKTEQSQKIYDKLSAIATAKFGDDEDDPQWRAYTYGGLTTTCSRILSKK